MPNLSGELLRFYPAHFSGLKEHLNLKSNGNIQEKNGTPAIMRECRFWLGYNLR